jgi:type IV pilus assembly protein PilF
MKNNVLMSAGQCSSVIVAAFFLTACITVEEGPAGADDKKALEYSTQLARSYIRDGKWEAAQRNLRVAQKIDPNNADVNEGLAMVYAHTGEVALADSSYVRAVSEAKDEDKSRIRFNYASYLYDQGSYKKALDQLSIVTDDVLYENRANAFLSQGICYIQLKDYPNAQLALDRAYQFNQTNVTLLYQLARINFLQNEYPKAQQFYDQYRKLVKTQTAASLMLGIQLAEKFGDTNAIASYGLVLKNLYPKSQEYLDYRAKYER